MEKIVNIPKIDILYNLKVKYSHCVIQIAQMGTFFPKPVVVEQLPINAQKNQLLNNDEREKSRAFEKALMAYTKQYEDVVNGVMLSLYNIFYAVDFKVEGQVHTNFINRDSDDIQREIVYLIGRAVYNYYDGSFEKCTPEDLILIKYSPDTIKAFITCWVAFNEMKANIELARIERERI